MQLDAIQCTAYQLAFSAGACHMNSNGIIWPQKARDLHNHHFDSTIWDEFEFRDDDIIIATYAKAGTTWLQQIVSQLIFKGKEWVGILS